MKIVKVDAWELGKYGFHNWGENTLKFLSVPVTLYVAFVLGNVQIDGVQWSDFVPNEFVLGGIITYAGNVVLDFFRKFAVEQTYIVEK